jgi:hypothetical protein
MKSLYFLFLTSCLICLTGCERTIVQSPETVTGKKISKQSTDIAISSVAASSALWSASYLYDNDTTTIWSSNVHASTSNTEWVAYWFNGFYDVNYIELMPRYGSSGAMCFPVTFNVYYSNGSSWVLVSSYTSFPTPQADWVILPLSSTVNTNGIHVVATTLGVDNYNNAAFQLGEVGAGYNAGYNTFNFVGNNGVSQENEIRNVGSGSFNPNKLSNWNYDYRNPIMTAQSGGNSNIYAPNVVYNGAWNIYFGGWDGTTDGHDRVSISVSYDNFLTFGAHSVMIDKGVMNHCNNETVIKQSNGTWLMYYTTLQYSPALNKPAYATSSDGASWTPNAGSTSYLINMSGYNNWSNADVNGSNVIYYENGTYHLYFDDFNYASTGHSLAVNHATSTDMVNFTYTGNVLNEGWIAQDVKLLNYNSTNYYLMCLQLNTSSLRYSLGTSPTSFSASQQLLTNLSSADQYITSGGFVVNNNRLYGVLYGAGPSTSLSQNSIHAKWLQKKVIFVSNNGSTRWGDVEKAYGPDRIKLYMNANVLTGHFYVYDTDGTTLLFTSPPVTIRSGDIWQYVQ